MIYIWNTWNLSKNVIYIAKDYSNHKNAIFTSTSMYKLWLGRLTHMETKVLSKILSFDNSFFTDRLLFHRLINDHCKTLTVFGIEINEAFKRKHSFGVNPTSHGVSDSVVPIGGGLRGPPPKKSRKESFLTPCCYIAFIRFYI